MAINIRQREPNGYKASVFLHGDLEQKFLCNFCKELLKDPIQTFCGHRYCRHCLEHIVKSYGNVECMACLNDNIHNSLLSLDQINKDRAILRELNDCRVRCINESCDWKGTYKQYNQEHIVKCPSEKIMCTKDGCEAQIRRDQMTDHLKKDCVMRLVACQYCKRQLAYKELYTHSRECPRYPTKCQFCGIEDIPRDELKDHQDVEKDECPKKLVFCQFKAVGCEEMVQQDKVRDHETRSTAEHLLMLLQTLAQLFPVVQTLKGESNVDEVKGQAKKNSTELNILTSKVKNLGAQIQEMQNNGASWKRIPSGTYTSDIDTMNSRIEELHNKQTVLQTRVSTSEAIVAVLNNQIERDAGAMQTLQRQSKQDREIIESLELKIKSQDRIIALKDVAMAEQDLRIQSLEMASYNGELVWKISNFSKKRQEAISSKTTSIYSPCFYTSRHGYKMCARIYLNGDGMGKGNHVSVFFTIMKGPFDALLRWPFRQKVTLMWLDQNSKEHVIDAFRPDPTSSSFKRPVQEMNIASGCPLFMPLSQLDSPRHAYVKDDVAFLKIMVDVIDLM